MVNLKALFCRFLLKFYLGIPEPQWVTQKLTQSTQLLGIGGRSAIPHPHSYVGS